MEADLVAAAAALRWARPDLTAELADHVLEEAAAAGQQDRWLAAAGWAVHARAATGDGRETACGVLAALGRWGSDALVRPAAYRVRVELAMVAAGAGEVEFARLLLAGVPVDDGEAELTADLLCAHARCAVEDAPHEVAGALDAADAAWAMVGGAAGELGGASVALIRAVVQRRAGRPEAAVDHAADGLARLERGRTGAGTPSGHLAAALAAEWMSALLDAGRAAEARNSSNALLPRLSERARPTRQLALLRLTVARALAAHDAGADTAQLLMQAAEDAAGSDVPGLEAVCRTALGALHEQASRLDVALGELQLAVGAERRDRDRSRRFLAALAELAAEPVRPERHRDSTEGSSTTGHSEPATPAPAMTRRERRLLTSRREAQEPAGGVDVPEPAAEEGAAAWDAVPWNGSAGDSPIGDLLINNLRDRPTGPAENGERRRNGHAVGGSARHSDDDSHGGTRNGRSIGRGDRSRAAEPPEAPSGWMPTLDSDRTSEQPTPGRRRGRFTDADRRRPFRQEPDEATGDRAGVQEPTGRRSSDQQQEARRRPRYRDVDRPSGVGERTGRHSDPGDDPGDLDEVPTTERFPLVPDEPSSGPAERRSRRKITPDPGPADDLWATGRGSVRPDPHGESEPAPAADDAVEYSAATSSSGVDDSDGWLQAALADLDKALSGIGVSGSASTVDVPHDDDPQEDDPHDDGPDQHECSIVVDIARDGRRFAGPRAAAVVRSVAELLADRLPAGARTRFGEGDALVITGPGWSRADVTGWMHRTLPSLLDGFVAAEELPGAQLRVAVHDADGPVGAQILQHLTPRGREREPADERRREPFADQAADPSEAQGRKFRAARAGRMDRASDALGRRLFDPEPAGDDEFRRWPWSGENGRADPELRPDERGPDASDPAAGVPPDRASDTGSRGRHDADRPRSTVSSRDEAVDRGSPGRARRRRDREVSAAEVLDAETSGPERAGRRARDARDTDRGSAGDGASEGGDEGSRGGSRSGDSGAAPDGAKEPPARKRDRPESTDGLGIADLLAGALAAYRGI